MTGSDQQPGPPRIGDPACQQPGQHLIADRIPGSAGVEVVFKVIQQYQHRHMIQDLVAQGRQPVLPALVRLPGQIESPGRRKGVLAARSAACGG